MPLRFLLYAAKTYGKMVPQKEIYERKAIPLPVPEFFVFYTGIEPFQEQKVMRLSDSFQMKNSMHLELEVQCFNINYPLGAKMLEHSKTLQGYSQLLHLIRHFRKEGYPLEQAIDRAIQQCKTDGLLTAFLNTYEGEMRGMLFRYLNDDEFREVYTHRGYVDGLEDGKTQGMAQGAKQKALETAAKLKAMGLSAEQICDATGLSAEELAAL